MKEELISFETAKLAKDKGFEVWSPYIYSLEGDLRPNMVLNKESRYEAPTQSLLKKWLREVHNIHVSAFPVMKERYYYSLSIILDSDMKKIKGAPYDPKESKYTYEEALEAGLYEALKII